MSRTDWRRDILDPASLYTYPSRALECGALAVREPAADRDAGTPIADAGIDDLEPVRTSMPNEHGGCSVSTPMSAPWTVGLVAMLAVLISSGRRGSR